MAELSDAWVISKINAGIRQFDQTGIKQLNNNQNIMTSEQLMTLKERLALLRRYL